MLASSLIGGALAAGGFAYLGLAFRYVGRALPPAAATDWKPPVTVMVPAHGQTPRLEECLRSICSQDYPTLQVVFGLHAEDDPARAVIERIQAEFPNLDTTLVINSRRAGSNPKNANLANMYPAAKYDILAMIDSDVLIRPDFLAKFIQPLANPATGGVTALYTGSPEPNLASRVGALFHCDWFIPSVLVDLARRDMDICYGAAIAVTRKALTDIGGFEAMADAVAQDFVFGYELHRNGYRVELSSSTVATVVAEPSFSALMSHELRWNRAIRAIRPMEHFLSIFMSPLGPMLLLVLFGWPLWMALPVIVLHIALRIRLHHLLRERFDLPPAEPLLVPLRELVNFAIWLRTPLGRKVQWDGRVLVTGDGLRMKQAD
ncbi:bacteriohopanetetrol glucosamine biosynthesis glycosyltransferase HpnI [Magnetospirillum molischianum]|uniref:Hopanoid biosynthesis associated glycosyl transferase protein HpnI n=1 Tax=Magnetospirillum molischianum DSM 120 TaxID=1150626 RepID=H8FNB3_MAGML|nr:bacteriohopanetetrol glucosamine biosynthesis glycosyltransferase HpnI [Magnetospirillum molischianum]CCG39851.1 Hopanoid biosynthesis associated glycosyl transferase protein HpnI [Magnetospirillum molischianum DSM 120]